MNDKDLIELLHQASDRVSAIKGPILSSYRDGESIAIFIRKICHQIELESIVIEDIKELWGIFSPTCDWDDVVGDVKMGNEIFDEICARYKPRIFKLS